MTDDTDDVPAPQPTPRRRLPRFSLPIHWSRLVIGLAVLGAVWAIAHYVAVSTLEGDCQSKVAAARAEFDKQSAALSAQITGIRAEVAAQTALAERRGKANRDLTAKLRTAQEDVAKAERALREAEANWRTYYDKLPEQCRLQVRPQPRPGGEPDAAPTPAEPPRAAPGRIPLPQLRPQRQ